jgi:hypothetical protein
MLESCWAKYIKTFLKEEEEEEEEEPALIDDGVALAETCYTRCPTLSLQLVNLE